MSNRPGRVEVAGIIKTGISILVLPILTVILSSAVPAPLILNVLVPAYGLVLVAKLFSTTLISVINESITKSILVVAVSISVAVPPPSTLSITPTPSNVLSANVPAKI